MIDFKNELNSSQLEVVNATQGPVLVIAGAGSGKTRVIEYRVANLIRKKVLPQAILLLTFTRRAANSMLSRASSHESKAKFVQGGTFHSFAYLILKKYSSFVGFDNFSILDEDDSQEVLRLCGKNLGVYELDKKFPKKDTLKRIISMAANKEKSIMDVLEKEYSNLFDYASLIEKIKNDYQCYKIEKNYFDFDDLLIFLKKLLTKKEDLRIELSRQYQYIMVDEYQDTNKPQAAITYLLSKDHRNIMVVGDDAQSIYGFRGADHENIMEFPKFFPECRTIKLEANYRSHQKILDVANAVLNDMKSKFSKRLVSARKIPGDRPELLLFRDGYEEAQWLAKKIRELRDEGVSFCHQAVLFRSAYVSISLQMELKRQDIPFMVFGGLKFYESAHIKDLISYLKIIANPKDELAWIRILTLIDGVGVKTAEGIISKINFIQELNASDNIKIKPEKFLSEEKTRFSIDKEILYAFLRHKKYERDARELIEVLERAGETEKNLYDAFSLLMEYYYPIFKEKFDDWQQRINDLEVLKDITKRYFSLRDFLADFAIDPLEKTVEVNAADEEKPVCLSTIHSAKGLEWECVFLIGLVEGVLPVSFSFEHEKRIEEEHRLFYVALTRAKKYLYLAVHYENRGFSSSQFNQISRFIDSPEVLSKLNQKTVNQDE